MDKDIDVRWIGWVVVLLPYEIGLLFYVVWFSDIDSGGVFRHIFVPCHPWYHCFLPQS